MSGFILNPDNLTGQSAASSSKSLQDIANQTLNLAPGVAPGQVTPAQQKVLAQKQQDANSAWAQYYHNLGLSSVPFDPEALVASNIGATAAGWSNQDVKNSLSSLNLSSQAYNEYLKDEQVQQAQTMKLLVTAAAVFGSIISGGTLAPVLLPAAAIYDEQPTQ